MAYDLLVIGEVLMDMTPKVQEKRSVYVANEGGAPLNAAIMAGRIGAKVKFLGKVGCDIFGDKLVGLLEREHVDYDKCIHHSSKPTSLAFVQLDEEGERKFTFYRAGAADIDLEYDEIKAESTAYKCLYFGSVALTMSPLRETTIELAKFSKENGKIVFYDPNYRPMLWTSEKEAIKWMVKGMYYADIVKVSEEEARLITGENDLNVALKKLHNLGPKGIFLTKGSMGVCVSYNNLTQNIPALGIEKTVDMTGAGDAFFGAVIGVLSKYEEIYVWEKFKEAAQIGVVAAGLSVKAYGAIPSYPLEREVRRKKNQVICIADR